MADPNSNIILFNSDGVEITVERGIMECSTLIRDSLDDMGDAVDADEPMAIPIPDDISESVLEKVIEWCTHHRYDAPSAGNEWDNTTVDIIISDWDKEFMQVEPRMVFDITLAAISLDIEALLDLGCKTVASIKGKSPEEIREMFIWLA